MPKLTSECLLSSTLCFSNIFSRTTRCCRIAYIDANNPSVFFQNCVHGLLDGRDAVMLSIGRFPQLHKVMFKRSPVIYIQMHACIRTSSIMSRPLRSHELSEQNFEYTCEFHCRQDVFRRAKGSVISRKPLATVTKFNSEGQEMHHVAHRASRALLYS